MMRVFGLLVALALAASLASLGAMSLSATQAASAKRHQASTSYAEAEAAYREGRVDDAHDFYRARLDDVAVPSAALLYNLGNCAYQLERYAEASLYYRRALARGPSGQARRQADFNLRLTLRQLGIPPPPEPGRLRQLLDRLAGLRAFELAWLAAALQGLAIVAWLLCRRRSLRFGAALCSLLGLTCAVRSALLEISPPPLEAVVLAESREVHVEPHADEATTGELQAGEVVQIEEMSDRWARIVHASGAGWVERGSLGLID